jgi:hypothetical protein
LNLEISIFDLKTTAKRGQYFFFEVERAPSEIPPILPGHSSNSGQVILIWAAATLKGLTDLQNKIILDHYLFAHPNPISAIISWIIS